MRIVDRKEFLALPAGTIFTKFPAQPENSRHVDLGYDRAVCIKGESSESDWWYQDMVPWCEGVEDTGDFLDVMVAAIRGEETPPLDYEDGETRDGLFDPRQLFLVWSKEDAKRLISRFQRAFAEAYEKS